MRSHTANPSIVRRMHLMSSSGIIIGQWISDSRYLLGTRTVGPVTTHSEGSALISLKTEKETET